MRGCEGYGVSVWGWAATTEHHAVRILKVMVWSVRVWNARVWGGVGGSEGVGLRG